LVQISRVLDFHVRENDATLSCFSWRFCQIKAPKTMWNFLGQGVLLGLSAGVAPGPMCALVIAETLRHGMKSGLRVALVPLLTDGPIVLMTVFVLSRLSNFDAVLGTVSLVGAVVVLRMALDSLRARPIGTEVAAGEARSLRKGIIVNVFSPHPYLFWFTVGAPATIKAAEHNAVAPWVFVVGFYTCLVGAKVVLAVLVSQSKAFLGGKGYLYVMRFLGVLLALFALMLLRDGITFFALL
jgi:threonine/homoserine/homoserine lactone efflux protein